MAANVSHTNRVKQKKYMMVTKMGGGFASINDDILQNIVSRLPASSFGSAACVSKNWNKVCSRVLSRPKLAAALSLNASLQEGVKEVLDKVLSKPIRPQFVIASIGLQFNLEEAHQLITEKLDARIPVITCAAFGIIGRDAITNSMREVRWSYIPGEDGPSSLDSDDFNRGVVLIAGFLPGLKVDTIPLLRPKRELGVTMIDKFMMDVKSFTASVSGSVAPAGIILFGDQRIDITPVLAEIDCAMPEETVVVGDATSRFFCRSANISQNYSADQFNFDAIALVFAKDKDKPHDMGQTRFHVALATGVMPFGPELKAISVTARGSRRSWLTASMNGFDEILDSQRLLDDISEEIDDETTGLYIGVVQKRPSAIEPEKLESRTYMTFYEVLGGNEEYLVVDGVGIQPGDTFLFYHSDSETASSSCRIAFENLKGLKGKAASSSKRRYSMRDVAAPSENGEVFGGLMFACHYHGETYYDCFPFFGNFPGVPLAGVVCNKEIGRDSTGASMWQPETEETPARCSLHVCSTVFLVLSYVAPSSDY